METLARGCAGWLRRRAMTVVIGAAARPVMGTPPRLEIIENARSKPGEDPQRQSPKLQAAWIAAHAGDGAACGRGVLAI